MQDGHIQEVDEDTTHDLTSKDHDKSSDVEYGKRVQKLPFFDPVGLLHSFDILCVLCVFHRNPHFCARFLRGYQICAGCAQTQIPHIKTDVARSPYTIVKKRISKRHNVS